MELENADYSVAEESMERATVSPERLLHGINNYSGRIDDPDIEGAFVLSAVVDDGAPIEIHALTTLLEEKYCVLNVSRRTD